MNETDIFVDMGDRVSFGMSLFWRDNNFDDGNFNLPWCGKDRFHTWCIVYIGPNVNTKQIVFY